MPGGWGWEGGVCGGSGSVEMQAHSLRVSVMPGGWGWEGGVCGGSGSVEMQAHSLRVS